MNNNTCSTEKKKCCPCFTCPLTGFQITCDRTVIVCMLVMAIWSNFFSWIWHGNILASSYQETAQLWRGEKEMICLALTIGLTLTAAIAAYIFVKGYEGKGIKEGLRFGIIMTLLFAGLGLVTYATQPIPGFIITMWALGDLITYSVGGIVLGKIVCKMRTCKSS